MKADQPDPLLRALFDDDAWRASCREARMQAGSRLRRRRCWRKLRAGAVVIMATVGGWWLAAHGDRSKHPVAGITGKSSVPETLHLQLALDLPVAADGPLTVRAYDPLPEWTFHCEPLADSSRTTSAMFPQTNFFNDERELH